MSDLCNTTIYTATVLFQDKMESEIDGDCNECNDVTPGNLILICFIEKVHIVGHDQFCDIRNRHVQPRPSAKPFVSPESTDEEKPSP